jgi:hypothetical protein
MKSKRVQALVLATAVVAGYAGAAAFSAWGARLTQDGPCPTAGTDLGGATLRRCGAGRREKAIARL